MLAALRADLHNTSARQFNRAFDAADFLNPDHPGSTESKAQTLIAAGYSPSEAAALASSRQSGAQKLVAIDKAIDSAGRKHNTRRRVPHG